MTHIYQPLMIKTILESDNSATVDDIARSFVNEDRSYLEYYKAVVKRWPHQTLTKHKVVEYDKKTTSYRIPLVKEISTDQKNKLIECCNNRLKDFIGKDYWILGRRVTAGRQNIEKSRFDIMAKSKGVCVACGTPSTEMQLDIDHIVPINKHGPDIPDNMQALCMRCNRQKRDRDDTDFLLWHKQLQYARDPKCRLCGEHHRSKLKNRLAYAIMESEDDCFVTPSRHISSFTDMIPPERQLCMTLVDQTINILKEKSPDANFMLSGSDYSNSEHYRIMITQQ